MNKIRIFFLPLYRVRFFFSFFTSLRAAPRVIFWISVIARMRFFRPSARTCSSKNSFFPYYVYIISILHYAFNSRPIQRKPKEFVTVFFVHFFSPLRLLLFLIFLRIHVYAFVCILPVCIARDVKRR